MKAAQLPCAYRERKRHYECWWAQCGAVCCSVLQCVAVYCSAFVAYEGCTAPLRLQREKERRKRERVRRERERRERERERREREI